MINFFGLLHAMGNVKFLYSRIKCDQPKYTTELYSLFAETHEYCSVRDYFTVKL